MEAVAVRDAKRSQRKKTWRDKLQGEGNPHSVVLPRPYCGAPAGGRLFIASPKLVESFIRTIPRGQTVSPLEMRNGLARANGADVGCPTSTSIFTRIVSEVALEDLAAGAPVEAVTPFWRVVDPDSDLAGKLSCGRDRVRELRAADLT